MTQPAGIRTVRCVDRSAAVKQLPALHGVAIRLRDAGTNDHVIAVALDIDDDQVATLLHIADAKLANLLVLQRVPMRAVVAGLEGEPLNQRRQGERS